MKIPKIFLLLFAAVLALGAINPSKARAQVSTDFFYDNLSPYGEWVQCSYGYCWHPTNVAADWAPYTDGYWAYTDQGWTWVSYEDYGGIVYHYGRWVNIYGEGWVWVPGTQWAPAWVSWRSSPDYVGWAPLPPEAVFRAGFGFGGWADARFNIGPACYNFVGLGDFGSPALRGVIVNREQNVTIIHNTTNITNITTNNTTIFNGGPSYATVAARSSRPIPTLHLVRQGTLAPGGKLLAHQQGNQLVVIGPRVTAPPGGKFPAPAHVAKTLTDAKPDHGWDGVKDPQQRAQMQAKFKTEAPVYAPAKPVKPEELKVVAKIKTQAGSKPLATGEHPKPAVEPGAKPAVEPGAKPAVEPGGEPEALAKKKATETEALENKPAAEAEATPKLHKKTHPAEEGIAGASPAPKHKKSKKAATPGDESETHKHTNLEPFAAGDETKPKPKPEIDENRPEKPKPIAPGNDKEPDKKKKAEGAGTPPQ